MRYIDLGLISYRDAYRFQLDVIERLSSGAISNTLILAEHKGVITIGRSGTSRNILRSEEYLNGLGIEIVRIDRGGDVTYHGPGQLVAYPVFKLENEARDIHNFLRYLEIVGIDFLNKYNVCAGTRPGFTGVWVKQEKICSIGIGIKKWITYHGMAININTDMAPFSFIRPCGIEGVAITSLEKILGARISIDDAKDKLRESFEEVPLLAEPVSKVF